MGWPSGTERTMTRRAAWLPGASLSCPRTTVSWRSVGRGGWAARQVARPKTRTSTASAAWKTGLHRPQKAHWRNPRSACWRRRWRMRSSAAAGRRTGSSAVWSVDFSPARIACRRASSARQDSQWARCSSTRARSRGSSSPSRYASKSHSTCIFHLRVLRFTTKTPRHEVRN